MHGLDGSDGERRIDWGKTSQDYALHRPGYPDGFLDRLAASGVAIGGARVVDLGTGTGALARPLAARGARVTGVDASAAQVAAARELARAAGLELELRVAPAEDTGLPGGVWDTVTASQCWLYFDRDRAVREVLRLLAPGGRLVTCHLCWLPRLDPIAARTEALVLAFNPEWSAADWSGEVPAEPAWIGPDFEVAAHFVYDEPLPFTRASWRGRIRACRGVGAGLDPEQVAAFDAAHARLLEERAPETFHVLHRIDAHVLRPRGGRRPR